jgi:hypothetical protein
MICKNVYLFFYSSSIRLNFLIYLTVTDVLAVEQEQSSAIKKENKKPEINAPKQHGMIDQDQIGEKESQIIGKMLQRAALYKEDSSGGEEEETDDWVT